MKMISAHLRLAQSFLNDGDKSGATSHLHSALGLARKLRYDVIKYHRLRAYIVQAIGALNANT